MNEKTTSKIVLPDGTAKKAEKGNKKGKKKGGPANQATQRRKTIKIKRGRVTRTTIFSRIQRTQRGMGDNPAFDAEA